MLNTEEKNGKFLLGEIIFPGQTSFFYKLQDRKREKE
jgi:hypothetical protein